MKRPMLGGAHRGPVPATRQRRTIRLTQILLVVIGLGLFAFAAMSLRDWASYDGGSSASFEQSRPPSLVQPVVLVILGGVALGAAASLGVGRTIKVPTPARLDEFVDRAERVAIERAERVAAEPQGTSST